MSKKLVRSNLLTFTVDGEHVEGHPIGIDQIIVGDARKHEVMVGNVPTTISGDGAVLYTRLKDESRGRNWFVVAYESGARVKVRNKNDENEETES